MALKRKGSQEYEVRWPTLAQQKAEVARLCDVLGIVGDRVYDPREGWQVPAFHRLTYIVGQAGVDPFTRAQVIAWVDKDWSARVRRGVDSLRPFEQITLGDWGCHQPHNMRPGDPDPFTWWVGPGN